MRRNTQLIDSRKQQAIKRCLLTIVSVGSLQGVDAIAAAVGDDRGAREREKRSK